MAVASWIRHDADNIGPKQIAAPKEASPKGWWNMARKTMPDLPLWLEARNWVKHTITEELIHFEWEGNDLFISRKRNLR